MFLRVLYKRTTRAKQMAVSHAATPTVNKAKIFGVMSSAASPETIASQTKTQIMLIQKTLSRLTNL